jgi:hypothetical protein
MRVLDSPFPAYSTGTGDTMSEYPDIIVSTCVSARVTTDEDYIDTLGSIQIQGYRVYLETNGGISLGIDRYVLDELLRRERKDGK